MEHISIIVPIFRGKKYIDGILAQIEACLAVCQNKYALELLFINDDPTEPIGAQTSEQITVKVVETDRNRGIHGARVRGLEHCTGDYILFLDQDDRIRPEYFSSQLPRLGDGDAVVCRLINGKKLHYTDTFRFEEVITKDFILNHWCPIVSPGQVLIRKTAIPEVWQNNILVNNGADDYFLWLCMMAEGKRFALNQEVLFKHVITGRNTSGNTNLMMDSEDEMIEILKKENIFTGDDLTALDTLKLCLRRIHVKQLDTQRWALGCIHRLYCSLIDNGYICSWIKEHKRKKIAIYGAGELGEGLYFFLKKQGLVPVCYLDQNAAFILSDIPSYTMEVEEVRLECILLTIPDKGLRKRLENRFGCEVIDVEELSYYV